MSTLVFVDPKISNQADRAQSSRVPVPLPKDPYEAIRQAYLDGTNTESEPFEDPVETETPESPLTVAPPTLLPESNPPILVPILSKTAHIVVRVPPVMSSGLSTSMAEVAAMSESAFLEDDEEDDDEEDEEIEESLDSDSMSEDAEDEDSTPAAGDEGLAEGDEGSGMGVEIRGLDVESRGLDDESCGLDDEVHSIESDGIGLGEEEEEEDVLEGQQRVVSVVGTVMRAPLGLEYRALRSAPEPERPERVSASRQPTLTTWTDPEDGMIYIDVPSYPPSVPLVQTPHLPEWLSGLLPISPSPSIVSSPISSPMIPLTVPSLVATPATAKTKGFLTELGAQVEIQGVDL
ncbi:hypothetical protein Tco_0422538 [Tanacetum coccineum]